MIRFEHLSKTFQEVELLENHSDSLSEAAKLFCTQASNVLIFNENLSGSRSFQGVYHSDQGGFSGTAVTDDAVDIAFFYFEGHILQCFKCTIFRLECFT